MDDPDGVVTQGCLNKHPLTRDPTDIDTSPIDRDYPGRYIVPPECTADEGSDQSQPEGAESGDYNVRARYMLPEGLICEHCVLQMMHCELLFRSRRKPPVVEVSCAT